jgi:hypothetical protein
MRTIELALYAQNEEGFISRITFLVIFVPFFPPLAAAVGRF